MTKKITFIFAIFFISLTSIYSQKIVQVGADIDGELYYHRIGNSVSINSDGSVVAIGARTYSGDAGNGQGQVKIYKNNSGIWEQIGNDINGEAKMDNFGSSVSLSSDGSVVAIGAEFNSDNGDYAGNVRIFKNNSGNWEQIGSNINGEAADDYSGCSVSLSSDGSVVAIGAYSNDANGTGSGHVRIYKNNSGNWEQIGNDINGEAMGKMLKKLLISKKSSYYFCNS